MPTTRHSLTTNVAKLLTPSAISSVICVVIGLVFSLVVIFINRYRSSSLRLEYNYFSLHQSFSSSYLTGSLLKNNIIENIPLIFFWSLAGLVVYFIAADFVKLVTSAFEFRKELNYVHAKKPQLIRDFLLPLISRLVVVAIWIPFAIIFFQTILPYSARLAISASTASHIALVVGDIVLSIIITSVATHVHVVLLRLLFRRPRLFASF